MWQMMFLSALIFSALWLQTHGEVPYECSSSSMLPDPIKREKHHVIGGNETFVTDDALPIGWYSVASGFQLSCISTDLKIGSCGTNFPIWINGTHPSKVGEEVTTTACVRTYFKLCDHSFAVRIKNCGYHFAYYLQNTTFYSAYCLERQEIYTTGTSTISPKTTLNTSDLNSSGTSSSHPNNVVCPKNEDDSNILTIPKTVAIVISTVVILPIAAIALLIVWKNKTHRNRLINVLPSEKKNMPVCFVESSDKLDKNIILMSEPIIIADMDAGNHIPTKT